MYKKIIWLIILILIIGGAIYYKLSYPLSQSQLNSSFKHVLALPIGHFYNATEKTCGIWYESKQGEQVEYGRSNKKVLNCFMKAFENCETKNILFVNDSSQSEDKKIIYSLIRIMRPNDQNDCIIQNYFQEQILDIDKNEQPISYINTCTELSENAIYSCEPKYIIDARKKRKAQKDTTQKDLLQQDQTNDTAVEIESAKKQQKN